MNTLSNHEKMRLLRKYLPNLLKSLDDPSPGKTARQKVTSLMDNLEIPAARYVRSYLRTCRSWVRELETAERTGAKIIFLDEGLICGYPLGAEEFGVRMFDERIRYSRETRLPRVVKPYYEGLVKRLAA